MTDSNDSSPAWNESLAELRRRNRQAEDLDDQKRIIDVQLERAHQRTNEAVCDALRVLADDALAELRRRNVELEKPLEIKLQVGKVIFTCTIEPVDQLPGEPGQEVAQRPTEKPPEGPKAKAPPSLEEIAQRAGGIRAEKGHSNNGTARQR